MQNYTYKYEYEERTGLGYFDYGLSALGAWSDVDGTIMEKISDFTPIPALWANATDVLLFFLSGNEILLSKANDDPWYAATTTTQVSDVGDPEENTTSTFYSYNEPVNVLGCVSRYQFCHSNFKSDNSCTPLAGNSFAAAAADELWQSDDQRNLFNVSLKHILSRGSDIENIVSVIGIASLKARDSLSNGLQGSLPNNQWQLEVENWYGATLADFQKLTVAYATGPTDSALLQILKRPRTENERQLCHSVKIRSDAVTSYSILGLSILVGSCGLLIIVSFAIEPLAAWVGKKFGKDNYQQLEWMSNNILQLQRFAHEELGCGNWTGEDVPITNAGETLAVLDISEPCHPRLVNPASVATVNASSSSMDASPPPADSSSPIADAAVATVNASSPLMDVFPPPADPSSPTADAAVATVSTSSPLMDASPPSADPSSPIANAFVAMGTTSPPATDAFSPLVGSNSPIMNASSPMVVVSSVSMDEEASSFASTSLEDPSSSQQSSNVALIVTSH